jgi:hypothetical protein
MESRKWVGSSTGNFYPLAVNNHASDSWIGIDQAYSLKGLIERLEHPKKI